MLSRQYYLHLLAQVGPLVVPQLILSQQHIFAINMREHLLSVSKKNAGAKILLVN